MTSTATTQSDCVVVGASFAGLACATALARAGMRVIVLERKADVGEKLHTTGIIVKDAIDQIALLDGLPSSIVRRIEGVRLYAPSLRHVDLAAPGYYFLATDTPQLMRWLAERAVEAGAIIAHQTSFVTAQRTQSGFDLGDAGTTRFIVGADGPELTRRAGPRTRPKQQVPVRRRARVRGRGASLNPTGCTASSIGVSRRATSAGSWPASASCRSALAGRVQSGRMTATEAIAPFLDKISRVVDFRPAKPVSIRAGMIPCGGVVHPSPHAARCWWAMRQAWCHL